MDELEAGAELEAMDAEASAGAKKAAAAPEAGGASAGGGADPMEALEQAAAATS